MSYIVTARRKSDGEFFMLGAFDLEFHPRHDGLMSLPCEFETEAVATGYMHRMMRRPEADKFEMEVGEYGR